MNTETALLVIIFTDASRITREIRPDRTTRRVLERGLQAVGQELSPTARAMNARTLLVHGTVVYDYTANETREVCGI
jgi:hypothetical protein